MKGNSLTYTLREPLGVVARDRAVELPAAARGVEGRAGAGVRQHGRPQAGEPDAADRARARRDRRRGRAAAGRAQRRSPGPGSSVGQAIVEHPGIDKIAFTGDTSDRQGRSCARAADTLKKITLELGGKSPNIVFADADLDAALRGATTGIFYGKGEVCAAGSRLLVERVDQGRVHGEARRARQEDGRRRSARSEDAARRARLEEAARDRAALRRDRRSSEGATLVAGGERADIGTGKGYFVQPTVFDDVTPEMTIAREEIFGPVLATIEFADVDEAIASANDTPYGLAAGVWTRDIKKAHYVARKLKAGTVWVNTYNVYDTAAPFGGYKAERLRPRDERARARALHADQERLGGSEHVTSDPGRVMRDPIELSSRIPLIA